MCSLVLTFPTQAQAGFTNFKVVKKVITKYVSLSWESKYTVKKWVMRVIQRYLFVSDGLVTDLEAIVGTHELRSYDGEK